MIDFSALVGRMRGMVARPEATLVEHATPIPPWRVVAREHTLPLVTGCAAVTIAMFWVFLATVTGGAVPGPAWALVLLLAVVAIDFGLVAVMAMVVRIFAGIFGGRPDFNGSYMLVALALTPYFLGKALGLVPVIGILIFLAGLVYSMVILYRNTPAILGLPRENRGKHLALTLATMFLLSVVARLILLSFAPLALQLPPPDAGELGAAW